MVVNNGTLMIHLNGELANTLQGFPDVFTPAPAVFRLRGELLGSALQWSGR